VPWGSLLLPRLHRLAALSSVAFSCAVYCLHNRLVTATSWQHLLFPSSSSHLQLAVGCKTRLFRAGLALLELRQMDLFS